MAGSASETRTVVVEGRAQGRDTVFVLGEALNDCLRNLIGAGAAPHHLSAMAWECYSPEELHPGRRCVDLAWREVFAGFRPPLSINKGDAGTVTVRATANVPLATPPGTPVFRDYGVAELARQMSPRNQVPDMLAVFRQWTRDGAVIRARHKGLDISYADHRDCTLDLYRPDGGAARPHVFVFVHGGYWQAACKDQHAQVCEGMLRNGFAVANIDYPLAPETPLASIVEHVRDALNFLVREQDNLGIDAGNMHVSGHSAGGHLAAMMASDPLAPPLRSALLLSGIFDVAALAPIPMGPVLGLKDDATIKALSPVWRAPRSGTKIAVSLGGLESDEFKRQSAEIAQRWGVSAPLQLEGAHHFNLIDGLNGGPLLDLALSVMRPY
jgi:arylformamidase